MGFFPDVQRLLNSAALSLILPNFELVRDLMVVLLTCKMKKIRSKNEGASLRVFITLYINLSYADNSGVGGGIWLNFEVSQAFMHILVTCKNEDYSIKNEGARVATVYFPYKYTGIFSRRSRAATSAVHCPIWPNLERCYGCPHYLKD